MPVQHRRSLQYPAAIVLPPCRTMWQTKPLTWALRAQHSQTLLPRLGNLHCLRGTGSWSTHRTMVVVDEKADELRCKSSAHHWCVALAMQSKTMTDVWCKCFPGGKIENIAPRLPKVTRENYVIVIAAGSNNIPSHDVATIIRHVSEMIDDLHYARPNTQLVIPAIPRRYDDPNQREVYRDKIERVNIFLEHKCK